MFLCTLAMTCLYAEIGELSCTVRVLELRLPGTARVVTRYRALYPVLRTVSGTALGTARCFPKATVWGFEVLHPYDTIRCCPPLAMNAPPTFESFLLLDGEKK